MNEFKLIVAGGRDFRDYPLLARTLIDLAEGTYADQLVSIVSGMAAGADRMGFTFAVANNIKCYEFPADWNKHGKRAGFMRNEDMAQFSDGLVAFWNGSSGTGHMIKFMQGLNKPVHIVRY